MKTNGAFFLLCAGVLSLPVNAAQDGHKLYEGCRLAQVAQDGVANQGFDYEDYYGIGYCHGVVQGVSESMRNRERFCLPDGTTFPQLTRVVAEFLEQQPEQREQGASQAAFNAMLNRYPCR